MIELTLCFKDLQLVIRYIPKSLHLAIRWTTLGLSVARRTVHWS